MSEGRSRDRRRIGERSSSAQIGIGSGAKPPRPTDDEAEEEADARAHRPTTAERLGAAERRRPQGGMLGAASPADGAATDSEARVIPLRGSHPERTPPRGRGWERRAARALAFVRRRLTGEYEVDEFGFDPDLTDNVLLPALRPLYSTWFRVEASGFDHVPDSGGGLVVANHSGTIPVDALMTTLALRDHHPAHRHLRMLAADLVFRTPVLGELTRKAGHALACNPDAERLLAAGELVGVWPEGYKGVGKPYAKRYQLQRFGRGGFVSAALRARVPIIPCAIVGAEEAYPMIGDIRPLARLLGLPYFPVTPTFPLLGPLGLVPLPSKWLIEFDEPIDTEPLADRADDPMLVFDLTDRVRETIQRKVYQLLDRRGSVFG